MNNTLTTASIEKNRVIRELEEAKRKLQISRLQKYGLQKALAKRIGTETRDIESLLKRLVMIQENLHSSF